MLNLLPGEQLDFRNLTQMCQNKEVHREVVACLKKKDEL